MSSSSILTNSTVTNSAYNSKENTLYLTYWLPDNAKFSFFGIFKISKNENLKMTPLADPLELEPYSSTLPTCRQIRYTSREYNDKPCFPKKYYFLLFEEKIEIVEHNIFSGTLSLERSITITPICDSIELMEISDSQ